MFSDCWDWVHVFDDTFMDSWDAFDDLMQDFGINGLDSFSIYCGA